MKKAHSNYPCNPPDLEPLIDQILEVRRDILRLEGEKNIKMVHPANLPSARNLIHYMAFRLHDLRTLQLLLSEWGLSSLGRAERKVQATLDTVLHTLHALAGRKFQTKEKPPVCYQEGRRLLEENSKKLLGELPAGRRVRIMVTIPSVASQNYDLVKNLLLTGMNCARINCAHDGSEVWGRMVENIRKAEEATGKNCRILMDLGGPKLRTGAIEPGVAVAKIRPQRNTSGKVIAPANVWLYPENNLSALPKNAHIGLPLPADWLQLLEESDQIRFKDARGAVRRLKVREVTEEGVWAILKKTAYFTPGLSLQIRRMDKKVKKGKATLSGGISTTPGFIPLKAGDTLVLTKKQQPGRLAVFNKKGELLRPASVCCTAPEVFSDIREGEPVWFDDGKIGGVIERIEGDEAWIHITQTKPGGDILKGEKGINLPETQLHLAALSGQDLEDLKFVVQYADMVGLSFVNCPEDVQALNTEMRRLSGKIPAIVLKIETRQGFDYLPDMLLAAMENPVCGVMIARGDLAIECGFGRLAEVQEQILWVCEAAHVPVIWATQVLEGLAKMGLPTRAEVTDAAMGQRAECIMLNKGDHILEATKSLDDILYRMQDHQTKKRSLLRRLNLAEKFFIQT